MDGFLSDKVIFKFLKLFLETNLQKFKWISFSIV